MLIGDLARLSGLSKDGIRHYEEMGIVYSVPREAGSRIYREYDPTNLDRIEKARQAQQLGLTLKEIGPLLDVHESREVTEAETITFLEERLAVVQGRIAELRRMERFIEAKLSRHRTLVESSIASTG
ncbi:MerR family transcriptional regulator [Roseospira marina]|uniref:MerR family transcriptional regulator n=1 Tax=Roseospira marina TaxID=140057 RepID=A0A5M6IEJ3_9PROT|nr:MerR family transcriptional regulator [Roseospira marina]KAA5606387.1 MerR family transcriptional regulator [Roseospira marina]MBB4314206.1 DNA-binding transcriptional MerR regulator [Roseospira marina]MBB5087367.1 DNA-binding transcriptional MerR regulator [Roseospira marina]